MELSWDGGTKVCSRGLGHMNRMATMPINVKTLNFFRLPRNRWTSGHGTWYPALGTWTHLHVFTWVNLELFYGKIKFGPYAFVREVTGDFFSGTTIDLVLNLHQHATMTKGLLTSKFCPRHSSVVRPSKFSNIFSEATGPIEAKLYVAPRWVVGNESLFAGSGSHDHMTKMTATPIMIKLFFLPRNQLANGHRTWYAALVGNIGPL